MTDLARKPNCSSSSRVRLKPRFWVGKVRQEGVDECVGEVGLEVTVQEQQTKTVETLEGRKRDQERNDIRTQHTFSCP